MEHFNYITLREKPELKDVAAEWYYWQKGESLWGFMK